MAEKTVQRLYYAVIWMLLFLVFTVLAKIADVKAIGEGGGEVGFAAVNEAVSGVIGVHKVFYYISNVFCAAAFLTAAAFILIWVLRLVQGGGPEKAEPEYLAMIALYFAVFLFFLFFRKAVVNCGPAGGPKGASASYPSMFTVTVLCVFGSARGMVKRMVRDRRTGRKAQAVFIGLIALAIGTRILSGAEWMTDFFGGVLLGGALLAFYKAALTEIRFRKKRKRRGRG